MWENISILLLILYNILGIFYNLVIYDVLLVSETNFVLLIVLCNTATFYIYASIVTFYHITKRRDVNEVGLGVWNLFYTSFVHPIFSIRLLPVHKRIVVVLIILIALLSSWGLSLENKGFYRLTVSLQSLGVRMAMYTLLHDDVDNLRIEQILVSPFYYLDNPYGIFDTYVGAVYKKLQYNYEQVLF